jgi:steroid delta-isomerase-like uncharacterized protein
MPENVQVARGVFEDLFKGKYDVVDRNYDAGFQGHEPLLEDYGREELKKNVQRYRSAFPDLNVTVDEALAAGDRVLLRWSARGTHRGQFLGQPATGRPVNTQGITVYTFRNGKIVEEWTQWDALGVVRDLGISAALPQGASAALA